MLHRRYAWHLGCPSNAVDEVKQQVKAAGGHVASAAVAHGVLEAWDRFFPLRAEAVRE